MAIDFVALEKRQEDRTAQAQAELVEAAEVPKRELKRIQTSRRAAALAAYQDVESLYPWVAEDTHYVAFDHLGRLVATLTFEADSGAGLDDLKRYCEKRLDTATKVRELKSVLRERWAASQSGVKERIEAALKNPVLSVSEILRQVEFHVYKEALKDATYHVVPLMSKQVEVDKAEVRPVPSADTYQARYFQSHEAPTLNGHPVPRPARKRG